jgi:predicted ATPase
MLTRLRFTNFKAWERVDLRLGRITGLFGTNSSGKTSLIQFLLLLKQTKDATDRAVSLDLNGDYVRLGTIRDAIFGHDEARTIDARISFDRDDELTLNDPTAHRKAAVAKSKRFSVETEIAVQNRAPRARKLVYRIDNMKFALAPKSGSDTQFELSASGEGSKFRFIRTPGRPWQLPGPVKTYAFPDQARTYFQNAAFLSDLELAFEAELDRLFYLGPLREHPQRDYLWARSRPSDVGQRGEKAIDAILAATEGGEMRNLGPRQRLRPFQEMIAYWLRAMGLIHEFKVKEIADGSNRWQALLRTRRGAPEVLLTDVGFGVSQILPVLTLLYYVPEGSTVILEQPEIHLHPLAQAHLADLILNVALHRRVQVILESHSEHLLLRLQRRVAEAVAGPDDVKLFFCDAPDRHAELVSLDLDLFGSICNWPPKFMGDAFGEAAEAEKARLKRRMAAE